jgi:hypothetical protein
METEIKKGDDVTVNDPISMNHECTGIVTEIFDNGIYKVTFSDGLISYHSKSELD